MTIRRHNPSAVHSPVGRYSHVTVHPLGSGLKRVVLAGQVGVKKDGAIAGDLAAQIEQAWDNVLACLALGRARAGASGEGCVLHHGQLAGCGQTVA